MNKAILIKQYQAKFGGTLVHAEEAVDFLLSSIKSAVCKGDKVSFGGFGIFSKRKTNARTARNPRTGEKVQVKASAKVKFTPAKEFKLAVASK